MFGLHSARRLGDLQTQAAGTVGGNTNGRQIPERNRAQARTQGHVVGAAGSGMSDTMDASSMEEEMPDLGEHRAPARPGTHGGSNGDTDGD